MKDKSIKDLYAEHGAFVKEAFPNVVDRIGPLNHMRSEITECIDSGNRLEFADLQLLLFSAWRNEYPDEGVEGLLEACWEKLGINKGRKWGEVNSEGFVEHIKAKEGDLVGIHHLRG